MPVKPVTDEEILGVIEHHLGVAYDTVAGPEPAAATLPPGLLQKMRQAAYRSEDLATLALIDRLPPDRPELAPALRALVGRFDWDALDALLTPSGDL